MSQLEQIRPTASDHDTCARLNDDCRWQRGDSSNFRHMMTIGVEDLISGDGLPTQIMRRAQLQSTIRHHQFSPGEGSERDFGCFECFGQKLFFKIDAYDRNLEYGSPDPADASLTVRVMTVMLTSEY
jgi:Protein of unknown function (DUF3768)